LRRALLAAGVDKRPKDECAALTSKGEPWGCKGPYQVFQRTLRRLNLPPTRLHALRAFFVTALLKGHVPVHVVRELVGHGNLATTQMYAAIVEGDRGAAVDVLAGIFESTGGDSPEPKPRLRRGAWRARCGAVAGHSGVASCAVGVLATTRKRPRSRPSEALPQAACFVVITCT
jgi:hypothetical protein